MIMREKKYCAGDDKCVMMSWTGFESTRHKICCQWQITDLAPGQVPHQPEGWAALLRYPPLPKGRQKPRHNRCDWWWGGCHWLKYFRNIQNPETGLGAGRFQPPTGEILGCRLMSHMQDSHSYTRSTKEIKLGLEYGHNIQREPLRQQTTVMQQRYVADL